LAIGKTGIANLDEPRMTFKNQPLEVWSRPELIDKTRFLNNLNRRGNDSAVPDSAKPLQCPDVQFVAKPNSTAPRENVLRNLG
jgi:hypothetical protein